MMRKNTKMDSLRQVYFLLLLSLLFRVIMIIYRYDNDTTMNGIHRQWPTYASAQSLLKRGTQLRQRKANIPPIFSATGMLSKLSREEVSVTKNVLWRDLYAAAMLDLDRVTLLNSIQRAEAAIQQAFAEQRNADDRCDVEELQAMRDAIRNLEMLRKLELTAPTETAGQGPGPAKETI